MPALFFYLAKLSISLGIVYLFYQLLLRRLTFYNWNRWYLIGYSILCFFVSFINIAPLLERNHWGDNKVLAWVPSIPATTPIGNPAAHVTETATTNSWNVLGLLLVGGMVIMLGRLLFQLYSFRNMKRKAHLLPGTGARIYQVNETIIPFSFGNSIFLNQQLHSSRELEEIIRHEFVHVRQRQTLDLLWAEGMCLINWFNPFAWLLKAAIRQNLEFIADNKVVANGINKKQYQYLLLKVIGNNQFSIASKFNFSSLKKRIAMMNKLKSARVHALRFLFLLPLLSALLLAFRSSPHQPEALRRPQKPEAPGIGTSLTTPQADKLPVFSIAVNDTVPDDAMEMDTVPAVTEPNEKGYYIDVKGRKADCVVVVKDGQKKEVKRVLLTDWKQKEDYYTALYGEIQMPPPPTPPTPPSKDGNSMSRVSNDFEITDNDARITLKDGTTERYNLRDKKERAAFERKYGKIITIPAKVNAVSTATVETSPAIVITDEAPVTAVVSPTKAYTIVSPTRESVNAKTVSPTRVTATVDSKSVTKAITTVNANTVISPMDVTKENGIAVIAEDDYTITGNEDLLITINKTTSRSQLEDFKRQMKEKGIELNFDAVNYNGKGILTHISGTMKSGHGDCRFSATDFKQVILISDKMYFKVKVEDNKKIVI